MKNRQRKQEILTNDKNALKNYGQFRYELISNGVIMSELTAQDFGLSPEDYACMEQMRVAKSMQRNRIDQHMQFWLKQHFIIVFITLTFNNRSLELKPSYRRKLVTRVMEKCGCFIDYVANIDYGEKNDREHYHEVAQVRDNVEITPLIDHPGQVDIKELREMWEPYGWVNIKVVGDCERIPSYMSKLVSHSLKVKQQQIITPKDSLYHEYVRLHKNELRTYRNIIKQKGGITQNDYKNVTDFFKWLNEKDLPF